MTAIALAYYSVGLLGYGLVRGLAQAYYAVQDTRTPVRVGVIAVLANVVFILVLMKPMKLGGLALATSLASYVNAAILFASLPKKVGRYDYGPLLRSTARTLLATAVMSAATLGALKGAQLVFPGDSVAARIVHVGGSIAAGLVALLGMFRILHHEEMLEIFSSFQVRRRRRASRELP
jgi:putative peptidoglycan lipid II flippase